MSLAFARANLAMPRKLLFVYGTLKRGLANHNLLHGQEFMGEAMTAPRYQLYDKGPHPCLVEVEAESVAVHGELWSVDERALARLDEFEDVPHGFVRGPISLSACPGPVEAYFYRAGVGGFRLVHDRWP
jgi:gamma-glutamylcyclotransferase (GGCT)/AIG2-like uncharacterized protein YtfP